MDWVFVLVLLLAAAALLGAPWLAADSRDGEDWKPSPHPRSPRPPPAFTASPGVRAAIAAWRSRRARSGRPVRSGIIGVGTVGRGRADDRGLEQPEEGH